MFVALVIQCVLVNSTIDFVISLYSFIKYAPKIPVKMMNEGNAMFANISNVIITEQPFFSLTESANPTGFTPIGANTFLLY